MNDGQIFTGGEGRIVGPEGAAEKLASSLNDPDLHVAFVDWLPAAESRMYSRAMMEGFAEHPVLVLSAEVIAQWEAAGGTKPQVPVYEGKFPEGGHATGFGIVVPGSRS